MSSLYDIQEEGEVQYQQFPSPVVDGDERMLCLKGRDTHDGSWNYYGLAWPEGLPENATVMKGVSFVSYNHYDYQNIWHGLSALMPFVAWHQIQGKCEVPERWILYHWGELRLRMGKWVNTLMEATFGAPIRIEAFEGISEGQPVCFEKAVVMRHNEGGMSRQRRMETYDFMRCKARLLCNLTSPEPLSGAVGMTMLMRTGPRSFRNETTVAEIFGKECAKVAGCRLTVAYSNNLTFCEQVSLMGKTDILISPHGAQLTNMILMNRNSSVMEFFPKGWLELAGIGQYVYHWLASWSGMKHQGAWRDPNSTLPCPYSPNDRRCMSFYKGGTIGYNRTYFSEWAKSVLNEVKMRKIEEATKFTTNQVHECSCI
uniref:Glycosyltransferase 61 catalytic domain-containing protein n=1 Tax=Cucumis melo TaxID=3656 RepID=A0A9I9DWD4_CUCME